MHNMRFPAMGFQPNITEIRQPAIALMQH